MSKEDFDSMQETLYLYFIPGLVESILEASKEPLEAYLTHEEVWK